jgi:cold shock CspA family protein
MNGVVKKWDLERGFGWIRVPNGRDYFLHIKNWLESDAPEIGRTIEFDLGPGFNGKPQQAINGRYFHAGVSALTGSGGAE